VIVNKLHRVENIKMSFQKDPNHPWRAGALSRVKVVYADLGVAARTSSSAQGDADHSMTAVQLKEWLAASSEFGIDSVVAGTGMLAGSVRSVYEVGNIRTEGPVVDDGEVLTKQIAYDYFEKETWLGHSHTGSHMPVKPELNTVAVESLRNAQTIDEFAKVAGLKLARPTTSTTGAGSIPDVLGDEQLRETTAGDMLINQFEELRTDMARVVSQCDYGWRLWSMANVVAHALTLAAASVTPVPTSAMVKLPQSKYLLCAKLPYLKARQVRDNSWWYINDERDARYRALMILAGRGLSKFVHKDQHTVYSRMHAEPEVKATERMVFTTISGVEREQGPEPADFVAILANPDLAMAAYYAYAASVGVGPSATVVLMQAIHGPFLLGQKGILPYYPSPPKLDAMTSLLGQIHHKATHSVSEAMHAHANAALFALQTRVGVGAGITSFSAGSMVDASGHLNSVAAALRSDSAARRMLANINACLRKGSVGLHWLDPFKENETQATNQMVAAYRSNAHLLATYRTQPVEALKQVFTTGVDMHEVVLCTSGGTQGTYQELVALQLTAGLPLLLKCERADRSSLPNEADRVWDCVRRWRAVCRHVEFKESKHVPVARVTPKPETVGPVEFKTPVLDSKLVPRSRPAAPTESSKDTRQSEAASPPQKPSAVKTRPAASAPVKAPVVAKEPKPLVNRPAAFSSSSSSREAVKPTSSNQVA